MKASDRLLLIAFVSEAFPNSSINSLAFHTEPNKPLRHRKIYAPFINLFFYAVIYSSLNCQFLHTAKLT